MSHPQRPGRFTLQDLLTLLVVLLVCGLVLQPTILRIRDRAAMVACTMNIKQLTIGMHSYHDTYQGFPALLDTGPNPKTALFELLPFIEQGDLYQKGKLAGSNSVVQNDVWTMPVSLYLCPSDSTHDAGRYRGWLGVSSYPLNAHLMANAANMNWIMKRKIQSITDGTSNTIMLGERYAVCGDTPCGWGYPQPSPWIAAFNWGHFGKFQTRPARCRPELAQTAHLDGMNVGFADGSVRVISQRINPMAWQYMLGPDEGMVFGDADKPLESDKLYPELMKQLLEGNTAELRATAAETIRDLHKIPPNTIPNYLAQRAYRQDGAIAELVSDAMAQDGETALPELLRLLKDPAENEVLFALKAIRKIGPKAKSAAPELVKLIQKGRDKPNPGPLTPIQRAALFALLSIGSDDATHFELIRNLLEQGILTSEPLRQTVFQSSVPIGPPGPRYAYWKGMLLNWTEAQSAEITLLLPKLAEHPDQVAESGLLFKPYITHKSQAVQVVALNTLADLGTGAKAAIPDVLKLAESPSPMVRLAAIKCLLSLDAQNQEVKAAIAKLKSDPDEAVRAYVVSLK